MAGKRISPPRHRIPPRITISGLNTFPIGNADSQIAPGFLQGRPGNRVVVVSSPQDIANTDVTVFPGGQFRRFPGSNGPPDSIQYRGLADQRLPAPTATTIA